MTPVRLGDIARLAQTPDGLSEVRAELARLDQQLQRLADGVALTDDQADACVLAATRLTAQLNQLGLQGPYKKAPNWDAQ